MKSLPILYFMAFTISCNGGAPKNTVESHAEKANREQECMRKLDGEWVVQNSWNDSILIFKNTRNKNFKQEIFPSYNTIIFNQKNMNIEVQTYGKFGDGMSVVQNLKISNSKWNVENCVLSMKFDYSDYSGQHHLERRYRIARVGEQLILKKIK